MTDQAIGTASAADKPRGLSLGGISWALHQGARDPYVILITIYVFMPYFSTVVVGDPVRGQAMVAAYGMWSGLIVAFTAPLLGAAIDRLGPRKPGILLGVALMVPMIFSLWWTKPDGSGLSVATVVVLATIIAVLFAYIEMLHNALLIRAAGMDKAHTASGLGLMCGNGLSVLALIFVLWAFALPGKVDWPFIPAQPLFGLDPLKHETDRIVAPIAAVLFAVFGGYFGGYLDGRFGPKRGVQVAILGTIVCLVSQLGMRPDRILYFWAYDVSAHPKVWNGPFFTTLPELLYLVIGFGVAIFVTGSYASSRTLLTRLIPSNQTGAFFGLYALSGTATVWIGSMLVQLFTSLFKTQQAGFIPIAAMMVIGFVILLFVKGGQRDTTL